MNDIVKIRNEIKSRKPKFLRQEVRRKKRIRNKDNWRKPRGSDAKMRLGFKGKRKIVKAGYGSPKEAKFLTRDGFKEVRIERVDDLKNIKAGCIGVIGSTVGMKNKIKIINEAKKMNVQLSNYDEKFVKKAEEMLKQRKEEKKKLESKKTEATSVKEEKKEEKTKEEEKKEKDKILTKKGAL